MHKSGTLFYLGLAIACTLSAGDDYAKNLKKQGFKVFEHPTTEFGTGTITTVVPGDKLTVQVAASKECFPDIAAKLIDDQIQLLNSNSSSGLNLDVGAKYLPAAGLANVSGAFGFNRTKSMDVTFGPTKAPTLTVEGLMKMIEGRTVSKRCIGYLEDKNNTIILSAAQVQSMKYTFKGTKNINASLNADLLQKALNITSGLKYTTENNDTLVISSPMFIAGKPIHFVNLGLRIAEANDAPVVLEKGKFQFK